MDAARETDSATTASSAAPGAHDGLVLNNVEVIYDRVALAVKGVSVDVEPGAMVALLGANGAGKSTTLKSISGLLVPERGLVTSCEILFCNCDMSDLSPTILV